MPESAFFGEYGGRFVAETLVHPLEELEKAYLEVLHDAEFRAEVALLQKHYVGRPTPLYEARRWAEFIGPARVFLKREDLNHTGAHKVNNALGQCMLAKRMGKTRIIAETGAGQHGVATATVAAKLGLECVVYMGSTDMERQSVNVYCMELLGARVIAVESGTRTLKDALNEALRDWVTNVDDTFYVIGTAAGPHPYPSMVRDFQKIIGEETFVQLREEIGGLPDALVACVGGGSNAIGFFHPFIDDSTVAMYGVEAGGLGLSTGRHAAPLATGRPGVLHGNRTYLMTSEGGQILPTHSISAGLDYPGVGPEHAWLKDSGRVNYTSVEDGEAVAAFHELTRMEGILPALESAHAVAYAKKLSRQVGEGKTIAVCLSGRGNKDLDTVIGYSGDRAESGH